MKRYLLAILYLGCLGMVNSAYAQWVNRRPMHFARYGAMTAVVNNKIYVIGGLINSNTAVNHVEEYNAELDTWITRAPMPTARGLGVCGVVNNKIYVIGGIRARNMPVETVEVYDPDINQWQRRRRLPNRRTGYNGGAIGDSIYVCGGFFIHNSTYTDTVDVYCVSRDSWFNRRSMYQARVDFGAAVFHNHLYAISGLFFDYVNQNEAYTPVDDTWRMRAPIPAPRIGVACAALNNRIFTIGGERRGPRIVYSRVDVYNTENNSWSVFDSVNTARSYAGAVALGNNVYVVGGFLRNETPTASIEQFTLTALEESEIQAIKLVPLTVYPNPVTGSTRLTINTELKSDVVQGIEIYDNSGKNIKSIPVLRSAHSVIWDRTDKRGKPVKSGVYFATIKTKNEQNSFIKIVVLK